MTYQAYFILDPPLGFTLRGMSALNDKSCILSNAAALLRLDLRPKPQTLHFRV